MTQTVPISKPKPEPLPAWMYGRATLVFGALLRRVEAAPPVLPKHRDALAAAVAGMAVLDVEAPQ